MRLVCAGCGAVSLLAPGNEIEGGAKGNERLSLHTGVEILNHFFSLCDYQAMVVGIIKRLALAWIDVQVNDVWRGQPQSRFRQCPLEHKDDLEVLPFDPVHPLSHPVWETLSV